MPETSTFSNSYANRRLERDTNIAKAKMNQITVPEFSSVDSDRVVDSDTVYHQDEERDTTRVEDSFDSIDAGLDRALAAIQYLRQRLDPVLVPDEGKGSDSVEKLEKLESPLVRELGEVNKRIGWISAQVNDLTRRLQI